jgi:vacuolar-type H+-ATPase subunit I/STV1
MSKEKSNSVSQILDHMQVLLGQVEQDLMRDRSRVSELREQYQLLRRQGDKLEQQLYQYSELEQSTESLVKDQLALAPSSAKEMNSQE